VPIFAGMPIRPTAKIKRKPFANKPAYNQGAYNTQSWRKLRYQILQAYPVCASCQRAPSTVADHITPVRLGGGFWDIKNIQGLCAACHNSKSAKERNL
jgi:5-methylcytosine-specific restriction endonuclease McrA